MVLSEACDVFQGVGGVSDRAVMWGCMRETRKIIRERMEGSGCGWTCLHRMRREQCAEFERGLEKKNLGAFSLRLSLGKQEALFCVRVATIHKSTLCAKPNQAPQSNSLAHIFNRIE